MSCPAPAPPLCRPAVRVPLYPFAAPVRDYSEMARRYTHMFVNPDVVKVVFAWAQVRAPGVHSMWFGQCLSAVFERYGLVK